jgi:hypothetical protein
MRSIILCPLLFGLILCQLPHGHDTKPDLLRDAKHMGQAADFSGHYAISGLDGPAGDQRPYKGMAMIEKHGTIYTVGTRVGPDSASGIAIVKDGLFCVAWRQGEPIKGIGCTVFKRQGNDLVGSWASLPGDGQQHQERLRWLGKIEDETPEPPLAKCCDCCNGCTCEKPCQCNKSQR